jgi:site-specific DNA recombinase
MKAIILARVSTEEQRNAGNSLPAQQDRVRNYIERNELDLIKEFIFDESASKEVRKEFEKVIDFIREQDETIALCCDKIDRLSRDFLIGVVELERLRREGKIELHFASDGIGKIHQNSNAGELFIYNVLLSASQNYANSISDNTKRAFEQKRRNGEITGPAPIGYKSIPLDIEKRTRSGIVPDPETAHIIQKLFELYAGGNYSITKLWKEAKKMGLKGRKGKLVARSMIEAILKNTFYYGIAHSKKYNLKYPHKYECLITRDLYEKCKHIRESRNQKPSHLDTKPFIFRGLLTCKKCGCVMSPEIKKGKFIYYSCTNSKGICKREYVPEKVLLEPVYKVFDAFGNIPIKIQNKLVSELRKLNEGQKMFQEREISRIQTEYKRVQGRINALLDMRLDESITKDDYDKKLQQLKDQQYKLEVEQSEYTKADHEYHIHVETVLNLSRRIKDIFESSEIQEKRAILNFILQNPVVEGKKLEFTMRKPFNTVLELASCPNGLRLLDSNLRQYFCYNTDQDDKFSPTINPKADPAVRARQTEPAQGNSRRDMEFD